MEVSEVSCDNGSVSCKRLPVGVSYRRNVVSRSVLVVSQSNPSIKHGSTSTLLLLLHTRHLRTGY